MDFLPDSLKSLSRDATILFVTRFARLFAYGSLSVILVFYLVSLGLSEAQVGLLLTLTLTGDLIISLFLTTRADRFVRKRTLIAVCNIAATGRERLNGGTMARRQPTWRWRCPHKIAVIGKIETKFGFEML